MSITGVNEEMKYKIENDRRLRRMFYIVKQKLLTFQKRQIKSGFETWKGKTKFTSLIAERLKTMGDATIQEKVLKIDQLKNDLKDK